MPLISYDVVGFPKICQFLILASEQKEISADHGELLGDNK